ncbi:MAG: Uma2 family endonuclease, partial [Candidatus Binatia bacterium]
MNTQMETVAPIAPSPPPIEAEQRVILHGVSWDTYERLLADFPESNAVHFAYDQGVLEIMAPSPEHGASTDILALLVNVLAEEWNIDVYGLGSTTFRRADLKRGFEPDTCFYVQNADRVRGKKQITLTKDPPPDLVIEVDITSSSLKKSPIYAAIGVPEIWRYDGHAVTILRLAGSKYRKQ